MRIGFRSLEDWDNAEAVHTGFYDSSDRKYDLAADGERFVMIPYGSTPGQADPQSVVVVENWIEELKERVSVP